MPFLSCLQKNIEKTYEKIIQITKLSGYYTDFIGNLERDGDAVMFFIIQKSEETIIEFLQNYASIV